MYAASDIVPPSKRNRDRVFLVISSRIDGFSQALAWHQRKEKKLMIYNTFTVVRAMSLLNVNEKRLLFGK